MGNPVSYVGRGSSIGFNLSPFSGPYTVLPQLQKLERTSSKTDTDDATCLDSPGNNKFPVPVVVDNGKYSGSGVYDPGNPAITALQGYQQTMIQVGYKIILTDGTTATGLGYITKFEAPKVDRYKVNMFDFEMDIFGAETLTPSGGSPITE